MDNINNATARLRRTFAYPADDSSSTGEPDTMDEEGESSLSLQPNLTSTRLHGAPK